MKVSLVLIPLVSSFAVTLGVLSPDTANAAWSLRQRCNTSANCYVVDRSNQPLNQTDVLNVHVDQQSTSTWAKACIKYWHTAGGACDTTTYDTNADGSIELQPAQNSSDEWGSNNDGHFKYIEVISTPGGPTIQGVFAYGS